jgi:hypothetical protein
MGSGVDGVDRYDAERPHAKGASVSLGPAEILVPLTAVRFVSAEGGIPEGSA